MDTIRIDIANAINEDGSKGVAIITDKMKIILRTKHQGQLREAIEHVMQLTDKIDYI